MHENRLDRGDNRMERRCFLERGLGTALVGWTAAITTGSVFAVAGAVLWLFSRGDELLVLPTANATTAA
ncbi:MAG: hypothetical protein ABGZ17_15410 [Planctomycetaceae bacterium]